MKVHLFLFFTVFFLQSCALKPLNQPSEQVEKTQELTVMGWLEHARLPAVSEKVFRAKLDPGAQTSSIHALNIKRFKKGGKRYVRFTFKEVDKLTKEVFEVELVAPLVRNVAIKRHKGKSVKRPVVELEFILGEKTYKTEFSLADRTRFHYPMLLGRRFLQDVALVDSGKKYLLGDPTVGGAD